MPTKTPAAIYIEPGKPMVIDDIDLPDPGPTQVTVRHFATGVCHSQLHELHRPDPALPLVLGHESTGVVTATGGQVTHVKEGDHVMVTWVQRNATRYTPRPTPAHVTYRGRQVNFGAPTFTGTFTWSRDTLADQQMVVPLDGDVATDVTSIIGCAVMTGAGAALNAARVRPGNSVAIIGAGGVGLSMEQILHMARARRPGERDGGVAVLVGVPHGDMPTLPMFMLFGGKVYRGAPGGCSMPDEDFPLLVRWFKEGKMPLDLMVTRRYRLEQINEACDALARGEIAGRAIVVF